MAFATLIETPLGPVRAEADDRGLIALEFDKASISPSATNPILEKLRAQLAEYFAGKRHDFTVELSPAGTDFQKRVWTELCRIPHGHTISYEELAHRIGKPFDSINQCSLAICAAVCVS